MKQFKISEETVQGLIQYLAQRPYQEVVQGIQALSQLEPLEDKKEEK